MITNEQLKALRKDLNLTQKQMAKILHFCTNTYQKYEYNKRQMNIIHLLQSWEYLMKYKNNIFNKPSIIAKYQHYFLD